MAFPIVALGASAGGLEALFEFLSALPSKSGMAYVVIQHLDRDHKSLLAELLAKKTAMPVVQINDELEVEPDHVYVIPPNTSVTLSEGRFQLTPRETAATPHHPVDIFFNSLAEVHTDAAIGVVLSGGDSDGAHGVQAIKQGGGITFAQEPASTRFPGMPQSAIDTGCVDYVLRPMEIAREITRLSGHPYLHPSAVAEYQAPPELIATGDEEQLKRVFRLLRTVHGVDFSHYKRSTLQRRLARRMALRRADALADYVAVLDDDPAEAAALYQDFLIRVTTFFRDPESFEGLQAHIFPSLCEGRSPRESIRIWVPGCATGQEVYSIAIALVEYLGERVSAARIQIFGTDVSEASIEKARAGIYLENIVEEVSSDRLARFFVKEDSRYRIAKSIRDLCIFARHDVTRDPPFSRLDLVSCRNLLIYLDAPAQRRVMQMFAYSLRPQGFLMLGPSESVGTASDLFELVHKHHRMYTRKTSGVRAGVDLGQRDGDPVHHAPPRVLPNDVLSDFSEMDSVQREADRLLLARYAPASLLVDEGLNILHFRGETSPYLQHASGPASLNLHRVARPELLVEIAPAIQEARESGSAAYREGLRVDNLTAVTVEVIPLKASGSERCYLIVLEDAAHGSSGRRAHQMAVNLLPESEKDRRLAQLEREIAATRDYLQATMEKQETIKEELKAAHEEVLSANEEFQSTNEELETAKEELQSANEELTTTNDELRNRNRELSILNSEIQKSREDTLRAQRYADAIVESVPEPLVVLDTELRVLRANQSFYRNFAIRREHVEGRLLRELGTGQWNIPGLLEQLHAVLTHNTMLGNHEVTYHTVPGAGPRTLILNARKIPGDAERAQLILLAVEDVTKRTADAEQLRDAARRKDEFLAMLAHELRNPLTPIAHAIHLLRRSTTDHAASKLYDMIERQTQRLVRLVDELLDVARINRGHIELRREPVDLAVVVQQAADASRARIEERQHELSISLPEAPVTIDGDSVRLEQVVTNLLDNAAKYTEPGGRIHLKLTQGRGEALLSVRDNGIGLAPESLATIFELFTQVDNSLSRSGGGLGIGLTLVRRVLQLHGGRIEARSAGLGHGTEFIVQLPIAQREDSGPTSTRRLVTSSAPGRRVLIVDDNSDIAEMIELVARHWGHEVAVAHDGPTALELAARFRPEHALVDIGLPGMTGFELGRQLREQHPNVYLVALTGYGRDTDREKAHGAGFDAFLVKPADLDELHELLANGGATELGS